MTPSVNSSRPVDLFAAPREGIQRGLNKAMEAAEGIANGDVSPDNMVALLEARVAVKANAAVMRVADEMLGSFLNIKA